MRVGREWPACQNTVTGKHLPALTTHVHDANSVLVEDSFGIAAAVEEEFLHRGVCEHETIEASVSESASAHSDDVKDVGSPVRAGNLQNRTAAFSSARAKTVDNVSLSLLSSASTHLNEAELPRPAEIHPFHVDGDASFGRKSRASGPALVNTRDEFHHS